MIRRWIKVLRQPAARWSLGVAVTATTLFALATALLVFLGLGRLIFDTWRPWTLSSNGITTLDLLKISLAIAGGVGATQALVVAYRRQRHMENDESQLVVRFGDAATQLSGPAPALSLAGVYALAALADEWAKNRQQCINVLCAYLRLPYEPTSGENEVRRAIIDVFANRLTKGRTEGWHRNHFLFTGAVIPERAYFENLMLIGWVSFEHVQFLKGADFSGTEWHRKARFDGSRFGGYANFGRSVFRNGGAFNKSHFEGRTRFSRVNAGGHVGFSECIFRRGVSFRETVFSGGANWSGSVFGQSANFNHCTLDGDVRMAQAEFADAAFFNNVKSPSTSDIGSIVRNAFFVSAEKVEWGPFPRQTSASAVTRRGNARELKLEQHGLKTAPDAAVGDEERDDERLDGHSDE